MESFMKAANDLDKVLDEFERNEDLGICTTPPLKSQSFHQPIQNGFSSSHENGKDKGNLNHGNLSDDSGNFESDLLIDLSEADFAPAPQSSSLLASLTPGVLKPQTTESNEGEFKGNTGSSGSRSDSNTQLGDRDFSSYLTKNLGTTVNTLSELKGLEFQAGSKPGPAHQTTDNSSLVKESNILQKEVNSGNEKLTNGYQDEAPLSSHSQDLVTPPPVVTLTSSNLINEPTNVHSDNQIQTANVPLELTNGVGFSPSKIQEIQTENTKLTPVSGGISAPNDSLIEGKLLDPNLMETYLKQGARPKVLGAVVKTPDHSPQKSMSANNTTVVEPVATSTETAVASVKKEEKAQPVGFGNTTDISVSQADLEALEVEFGGLQQPPKSQVPQFKPTPSIPSEGDTTSGLPVENGLTNVSDDLDEDRMSPLSKLLNQSPGTMNVNQGVAPGALNNELAHLDPYFQGDQGDSAEEETRPVQREPVEQANRPQELSEPSERGQSSTVSHSFSSTQPVSQETPQSVPQEHPQPFPQDTTQSVNGVRYVPVQDPFTLEPRQNGHAQETISQPQEQTVPASQIDEEVRPLNNDQQVRNQSNTSAASMPADGGSEPRSRLPPNTQMGPNFVLPPDPPSYQQVQEWKAAEYERSQGMSREGLTLDFNQPAQRRIGLQHLTPSPIVEEVGVTTGYVRDSHRRSRGRRPHGEHQSGGNNRHPQQPNVSTNQEGGQNAPAPTQNGEVENSDGVGTNEQVPESMTVDIGGVPVRLGDVAPVWIPDTEAASCMKCGMKFTFRKRRHHCRACGKVFCAKCCNVRVKLKYMKTREARVCSTCLNAILTAEAMQRVSDAIQSNENSPENSSTGDPTPSQTQDDAVEEDTPPPNAPVQRSRSVLRQPSLDGSQRPRESRRVRFSDGIPAGSDSGETDNSNHSNTESRSERSARRRLSRQRGSKSFIPESEGILPPRLIPSSGSGELRIIENPKMDEVMDIIKNEAADPVIFLLSKTLQVHVKIVHLNCCVNRICWCFTTKGLATVGQDEIVFVLECLPEENSVPRDMLLHIYNIYQNATKGNTVQHLGHCVFTHSFLDSREHAGFLYLSPTYQCQQKLILPEQPYLYGVLLQKWELPWAKIFPLRLMLRLGAEFRYYPCPLMSVRFRKPVFQEIGHTIMNLLADFKNYQYMLPLIRGVVVHMQDHETIIHLPKNRYDDVMKVINNSNEHVMAIGANFSTEADSHLVCIQNDQGVYQTQAINRQNKPRKVTGASFMVLNGALKSSSGLTAKSSIVEDGLMVQIRPEMMTALRDALRNMGDFTIPCGTVDAPRPDETVILRWVEDDTSFNSGVKSPVDGRSLEGIESIRIQNTTDFQGQNKIIRWTEVFFIENGGGGDSMSKRHVPEPVDLSRLAENLAIAFCLALSENLQDLNTLGLNKLGLRVTVDLEKVGYEVGSRGTPLPDQYMNNLDDLLIPVLHNAVSQQEGGPIVLELIFYILD